MEATPNTDATYQPIQRSEAEWMALHREQMQKVIDLRKAGNYEKARYWYATFARPLRRNANAARAADSGTHGCQYYDASAKVLENMLRKCRKETSIISAGVSATPKQIADTADGQVEVSKPLLPPAADNAETTNAVTANHTARQAVRTIENSGTNQKFTKFAVGDLLHIPNHYNPKGYPVAAIRIELGTVRYGFALASWDNKLLHWYSENQLAALNTDFVGMAVPVETEAPKPPAHINWSVKIEVMEMLMRSIQSAVFENDWSGVETAFHEFQSEMFKTTQRNRGLLTRAKSELLAKLECREPEELPEPIDNIRQLPLLASGESEGAA